jgi:triphosphoribosyl-dephospho-CoA synthase
MPSDAEAVRRRAFVTACRAELDALKPGNVHVHAAGHRMTVDDFLASAEAAAPPLCRTGARIGARIRGAVDASWDAVPLNTNLGIVLLAAPLIAASERSGALRTELAAILASLTLDDARDAFAAIARANPAGLGHVAEQDVAAPPTVTLLEAMRLATDRDLIARQYATNYGDVFATGVARLERETVRGTAAEWATSLVFMDFLAGFPDSHIARKFGADVARSVQHEAQQVRSSLPAAPSKAFPPLLAFDRSLKERGINPGTSADLTVASLLAFDLARREATG